MSAAVVRCYMTTKSNILKLHERGVFQNVFPEEKSPDLHHALTSSPQTIYCGFDPTADSLHIGNLLTLVGLLHCQSAGHQCIAVIGGATGLIGDPSGKTTERDAVTQEIIEQNVAGIKGNIEKIFVNYDSYFNRTKKKLLPVIILNNSSWYSDWNVISFFATFGRLFRMGTLLSRQSIQSRLQSPQGINLSEFAYQAFQAYDWYHLYKNYNCTIQIGGNDQLGNMVSGYELIKRISNRAVFGLTMPLVTDTAGNKLGKTAGNAVWLSEEKTSPFDLYQFYIRLPDADVEKYMKLYTFLSDDEIFSIISKHKENPEKRIAQKCLAEEVVTLVHGEPGLHIAQRCTDALYSGTAEALARLSSAELSLLFKEATTVELFLEPGTRVFDVVMKAKCFRHESDAERVIRAGGVYVNNRRIADSNCVMLPGDHILPNNLTLIRIGKKNYYLIKWIGIVKQSLS